MAKKGCSRKELVSRWIVIEEEEEQAADDDESSHPDRHRLISKKKEKWFSDAFNFLIHLPTDTHLWCNYCDLLAPLLETFHCYLKDTNANSPLKTIWRRASQEMGRCTQCICQYHQAKETYSSEYESDTVGPLLKILNYLDEERVSEHLKDINAKIADKVYDPDCHSIEVVSLMFEVLMFPTLLEDQSVATEFGIFIEVIDNFHEVSLAGHQQYPGVYALVFLRNAKARAIGLRLAGSMEKLRKATDLEPMQPFLEKCITHLEVELSPPKLDLSRPRVQLDRTSVWLGLKALLGFLEAPAFEEGILERYPILLSIVLNHVSDDTPEFSYAVTCLKLFFEMLGCKLWLRTTLSPSMMRNTLLGQCFHTRNEKSHKEIFDLFLPFLQSLEALQDGEHEKQRRHFLYFLLHQVRQSSNFSLLMRKNACKIALLIIQRGYSMNPPCPPTECAHVWGPSLVSSLKDQSLHSSLRQPAFDLIETIIISDCAALLFSKLKQDSVLAFAESSTSNSYDDEDGDPLSIIDEDKDSSCLHALSFQIKLVAEECQDWRCIPKLWFEVLVGMEPLIFPISFSKTVFWAMSHFSMVEPETNMDFKISITDWLSLYAKDLPPMLVWENPKGCDDGGEGKESKNSVEPLSMHVPLIRVFKRLTAQFVIIMVNAELQKQWVWEPRMAESLILSLIEPNDTVRQASRIILEHVSKTRGLISGLEFLCCSSSSISALYAGLKYIIKQVLLNSTLQNFHIFHHLFFILRKLLKEVGISSLQPISKPDGEQQFSNPLSEGGFLRHPLFDSSPVNASSCSPNVVDIESWKKMSCLLSSMVWPFILKCLVQGKSVIDSKNCQMTCVRILEIIPDVIDWIGSSWSQLSQTFNSTFSDFKWLVDVIDWGKSSLIVVTRHWKQCMHRLMNLIRGFHDHNIINITVKDISLDNISVDEMRELVSQILLELSKESILIMERKLSKVASSVHEIEVPGRKKMPADLSPCESKVSNLNDASAIPVEDNDVVIVLSDDEDGNLLSAEPPSDSSCKVFQKELSALSYGEDATRVNDKNNWLSSSDRASFHLMEAALCKDQNDVVKCPPPFAKALSCKSGISAYGNSKVSSDNTVPEKILDGHSPSSVSKAESKCFLFKSSDKHKKSDQFVSVGENGASSNVNVDVIKELVSDAVGTLPKVSVDPDIQPHGLLIKTSVAVPKRRIVQLQMPSNDRAAHLNWMGTGVGRLKPRRLDDWYRPILELDYFSIAGLTSDNEDNTAAISHLREVPLCFQSADHYVEIFRPLVLEEFKAQLHNSYIEASSSDDLCSSTLSVLSVEKIDDFYLVRCSSEENESSSSSSSRMIFENDLVLLTKEPLKNSAELLHALGKVERREKNIKSRSTVLTIRFYFHCGSPRFNKMKKLLIERSKWYVSRIMSITPQLREFQALSSLSDIPLLPIILNPVKFLSNYSSPSIAELEKLPQPMHIALKSSFNDSQLQAIAAAIEKQSSNKTFGLSLIQGPPGTGKTRTIVAIVSALLSLGSLPKGNTSKMLSKPSTSYVSEFSNSRPRISHETAVARAWQDAALARQIANGLKEDSISTARSSRGRILICAQSNAAVDELVSRIHYGLYGNDGKMYKPYLVRVGNIKTVHPNSIPFFIDTLVEHRLAENKSERDTREDKDLETLMSLRSKLEKIVDNIRQLESLRAKLRDGELVTKNSEDEIPKLDGVKEISDAAIGAKLNNLYAQKKIISSDISFAQARERKSSEERRLLKMKIRKSILREAEIVVTTLSGCGGDIYGVCSDYASSGKFRNFLEQSLFDAVVIDEAAQALEPATLIPLQLLKSNGTKCIMVGDPKQLPATVLSNVASKFLYECSMFERLQRAGHPVIMLTEQYRMHPEICKFPSLHFYENKLLNGIQTSSKSALFHEDAYLGPYVFFDVVDGRERHGKNSGSLSLCNEYEAEAAVEILNFFRKRYHSEFSAGRIGIITPYRSQLSVLRTRFSKEFGPNIIADMEFNTVDGFQGREVDILILSTVRASDPSDKRYRANSSSIGFVADVRRMNVALTRAKLSLWIFGHAKTLKTNMHWAALINNSEKRDLFFSFSRPYKSCFEKPFSILKKRDKSSNLNSHSGHNKKKHKRPGDLNLVNHCAIESKSASVEKAKLISSDCCIPENRKSFLDNSEREEAKIKGKYPATDRQIIDAIPKSKGVAGNSRTDMQGQDNSAIRNKSTKVKHHEKGAEHTKQVHDLDRAPNNLIASRKRQRDEIDSLLSSALISSRKPEVSSRSVPIRRPFSQTTSVGASSKPPGPPNQAHLTKTRDKPPSRTG